ncbi:unnamed protein product [Rotaria sordida]|uniref:HAT C-terminal dimerisation domain-containing protein n=1 Tax=Rotaria sordida TaxID=392033 RepID=A0A815FXB7_9BILA|nr:unnamed protein product [Rotaria sordida]
MPSIHVVIPGIESLKTSLQLTSNDTKSSNEKDMTFFRTHGKLSMEVICDYHPIHLMTLFLNPRTRKMKQCTDYQRNSCLEYIKQEMIIFDTLDSDTQLKNNNKSIRKISNDVNRTLRIMQQYYEQQDEQNDLPTTTAAIHQSEIDNYLKFGIDKLDELCSSNSSSSVDQEYNPLHFWKHHHTLYPRLTKIAKRVFSVPATSAAA